MNCPVINFHKNRSKKWWAKYVGAWIVGFASFSLINFLNEIWEDKGNTNSQKSKGEKI
jgi:hypothetical protein